MSAPGEAFNLFDAASVALGSQFDDITLDVSGNAGVMNYETGVLTVTAVPQPSTLLLAGFAFLAMVATRLRANRP